MAGKVLLFGGGGRVGTRIAAELLRAGLDLAVVDILDDRLLGQKMARTALDSRLASGSADGRVTVYGNVNVLDQGRVEAIIAVERPDLVINYAIPITWDATKRLANYSRISRAGLGAFTPIQVCAPRVIGKAIANAAPDALYMVGNLPDITVPVLCGYARSSRQARPVCGAGNVGLIEAAIHSQLVLERELAPADVKISLVAHHIHWVAPREPGYADDAPFLLKVEVSGEDVTDLLGDSRALMNRAIVDNYEAGAGFSSTTGVLASRVALALLRGGKERELLHTPAPNGMPGGYPVSIGDGTVELALPPDWSPDQAEQAMKQAHGRDGIDRIDADGTVHFAQYAIDVLREEAGIVLPGIVGPGDMEAVGAAQIERLNKLFAA